MPRPGIAGLSGATSSPLLKRLDRRGWRCCTDCVTDRPSRCSGRNSATHRSGLPVRRARTTLEQLIHLATSPSTGPSASDAKHRVRRDLPVTARGRCGRDGVCRLVVVGRASFGRHASGAVVRSAKPRWVLLPNFALECAGERPDPSTSRPLATARIGARPPRDDDAIMAECLRQPCARCSTAPCGRDVRTGVRKRAPRFAARMEPVLSAGPASSRPRHRPGHRACAVVEAPHSSSRRDARPAVLLGMLHAGDRPHPVHASVPACRHWHKCSAVSAVTRSDPLRSGALPSIRRAGPLPSATCPRRARGIHPL